MKYNLKIEPSISPKTRHKIQDVLMEAGYEIIGGGTATDGSFSDISFEREDCRDKETK